MIFFLCFSLTDHIILLSDLPRFNHPIHSPTEITHCFFMINIWYQYDKKNSMLSFIYIYIYIMDLILKIMNMNIKPSKNIKHLYTHDILILNKFLEYESVRQKEKKHLILLHLTSQHVSPPAVTGSRSPANLLQPHHNLLRQILHNSKTHRFFFFFKKKRHTENDV